MRVSGLTPTKPTPPSNAEGGGWGAEGRRAQQLGCTGTHHLTLTEQRPPNTAFCSTHLSRTQSFISMKTEDCYKSYSGLQQETGTSAGVRKIPHTILLSQKPSEVRRVLF